jgi:hypothetical protein
MKRRVEWRLKDHLEQRGLTVPWLHQQLSQYGVQRSPSQVYRIVKDVPALFARDTLEALCSIFNIPLSALLRMEIVDDATMESTAGPSPSKAQLLHLESPPFRIKREAD